MKKIILLLMLTSPLLASGTKHTFTDPLMNDELDNVYHQIDSAFKNKVYKSTITLTSIAVDSMTVTHIYGPFANWVAYTPSFSVGWGTPSNIAFWYRRMGDTLKVRGTFTTGTVAGSNGTISLPSNLTIDSTKISAAGKDVFGWIIGSTTGTEAPVTAGETGWAHATSGMTTIEYGGQTDGSTFIPRNVNSVFGSSRIIYVEFEVPISGWSF